MRSHARKKRDRALIHATTSSFSSTIGQYYINPCSGYIRLRSRVREKKQCSFRCVAHFMKDKLASSAPNGGEEQGEDEPPSNHPSREQLLEELKASLLLKVQQCGRHQGEKIVSPEHLDEGELGGQKRTLLGLSLPRTAR